MRRKAIFVLTGLLILVLAGLAAGIAATRSQAALADDAAQALQAARRLYEKGDYQLAARTYQQVADQGYASAGLYYNLGLAYHGAGELGRAVWGLRSAQQLAPRDPAVKAALARVRDDISLGGGESGATEAPAAMQFERSGLAQGISLPAHWLTTNELALLAIMLWLLFAALLMVWWLDLVPERAGGAIRTSRIVAGIALVAVVLALGSRIVDENRQAAVVVADQVEIVAGPGEQYRGQVSLAGGAEVTVLDRRPNWTKLSVDGTGLTGWAPSEAVAELPGS